MAAPGQAAKSTCPISFQLPAGNPRNQHHFRIRRQRLRQRVLVNLTVNRQRHPAAGQLAQAGIAGVECAEQGTHRLGWNVEVGDAAGQVADCLGELASRRMALAIDGEIHQDALTEALAPDAEVVLIPRIAGG